MSDTLLLARSQLKPEHRLTRATQPHVSALRTQSSFETIRSDEERHYLHVLDQFITEVGLREAMSFAALSRTCLGAWPGLIADRVAKLGWTEEIASRHVAHVMPSYSPELHCGFGEWYFCSETANSLAREFISRKTSSIFLGTPTIARRALAGQSEFTLVDSNPFVGLRFPELRKFIHYSSVEQLTGNFAQPSLIMLDPPWYLPSIKYWLSKASQFAAQSTTIVMPLFQSLTRPAAARERFTILELAETIGSVELIEDCLSYDSPLYEQEALLSSRVSAHPNWRRADLLVIRRPSSVSLPSMDEANLQEVWETYLIGSQVVRLRLHPMPRGRKFLTAPIAGTRDYVLGTVSARDPLRKYADIWTSRNRIAIVGDLRRMRYLLSMLSTSFEPNSKVHSAIHSTVSSSEADELCRLLSLDTFH
jgi:hypothetical protein